MFTCPPVAEINESIFIDTVKQLTMSAESWVSLFSGGKDSSWALYQALEQGLAVSHLLTVHPSQESYMYHVPETRLAPVAASSIGIDIHEVTAPNLNAPNASDATTQGDAEIEPLEVALTELAEETTITGVTAGAIESAYQTDRIRDMCDRLGLKLFAPLWQESPDAVASAMVEAGFEITIIQVAAAGLDRSWLGRTLDTDALTELRDLREEYGVHLLGEGGEFETFVTDAPHYSRKIELTYDTHWEGSRGRIHVEEATLVEV